MAPTSLLTAPEKKIITLAAEVAESLSISPTLARIYALLYIRQSSLALPEIASLLGMSKGSASIHLRTLESWGAIQNKWVAGTRKDHYEAHRNLKAIVLKRIEEGLSRRLSWAGEKLASLQQELHDTHPEIERGVTPIHEQLAGFQDMLATLQKLLKFMPHIDKLSKFL